MKICSNGKTAVPAVVNSSSLIVRLYKPILWPTLVILLVKLFADLAVTLYAGDSTLSAVLLVLLLKLENCKSSQESFVHFGTFAVHTGPPGFEIPVQEDHPGSGLPPSGREE